MKNQKNRLPAAGPKYKAAVHLKTTDNVPFFIYKWFPLVILLFIFTAGPGLALDQKVDMMIEQLKLEQGLSHNSIRCIFQDSSGLIWFGTENGLNRYDGYEFTVYFDKEQPTTQWVKAIAEDRQGNLWIGTDKGGIKKYNKFNGTYTRFKHHTGDPNSLCSDEVTVLYPFIFHDREYLWIGTQKGLSRMEISAPEATFKNYRYFQRGEFPTGEVYVQSLAELRVGAELFLWVGTTDGLFRAAYRDESPEKPGNRKGIDYEDFEYIEGLKGYKINGLRASTTCEIPTLWVGTSMGLCRLTCPPGRKPLLKFYQHDPLRQNTISENCITGIAEDPQLGILWISTYGHGLNQFDPASETFLHYIPEPGNPNNLNDIRLSTLYLDRNGILWVGTYFNGVNKVVYGPGKLKFKCYRPEAGNPNSLSHELIRAILADPGSSAEILWIATEGGGLNQWNRDTNRFTHYTHDPRNPGSISDDHVYSLHFDASGTLWVGTKNSLDKMGKDQRFRHFLPEAPDPGNPQTPHLTGSVRSIYEDRSGILWLGTAGAGLKKFNPRRETFTHYTHNPSDPNSIGTNLVYTIYGTFDNNKEILWLGTIDRGMDRFDPETGTCKHYTHNFSNPNSITGNQILCFGRMAAGSGDSSLWIGTYGAGLIRFDPGSETFTGFTMADGLPDHTIYGLLADDDNNLWLSTNRGISKFNPQLNTFRNYSVMDGLQGFEFSGGAYYKAETGEMFFGGVHGLNVFHPANVKENTHIPPLVLSISRNFNEIALIDAQHSDNVEIRLSSQDKVISFQFTALDYIDPRKNQYAYKLENIDKDWIYTGTTHKVNYTHLAPGSYIFRVKGSNNDNVWNETGVSVKIVRVPTVWETPWFKLVIGLIGLTVVIWGYRWWHMVRQKKVLQAQVTERTRELQTTSELAKEMAVRAESSSRAKTRFLANISHEIRTPISGIIGITDLIMDAPLPEQQQSYFTIIRKSAGQLMAVLDDILDFSKLEAGQLNLDYAPLDLPGLLHNLQDSFREAIQRKGLKFTISIRDDVPVRVVGDVKRLNQILLNLVGNAVKFTEKGSVALHVQTAPTIGPGETAENGPSQVILQFSVSDTGIGIPIEQQQRIFEGFSQVDGSFSRQHGGAGLGLTIARQLIELMKGKIRLESQPHQGSRFYFTLPFQAEDQPPEKRLDEKNPADTGGSPPGHREETENKEKEEKKRLISLLSPLGTRVRILVVEDNPINRKVALQHVSQAKIPVDAVTDGLLAVQAVQKEKYDLILMDVQMPNMDGLTAAKTIRSDLEMTDIPIIAMTAHALKEDRQKCLEAGMNDYITKPFKPIELYRVLYKWLNRETPPQKGGKLL